MAENLRTTKYSDGTVITNLIDDEWCFLKKGAWSYYNNDSQHESTYGKLYNGYATTDTRNLCPIGWHIPTDTEWDLLTGYLEANGHIGAVLKSKYGWNDFTLESRSGTDNYGWLGLPGGRRRGNGDFYNIGSSGHWWSSSEGITGGVWSSCLDLDGSIGSIYRSKSNGLSVRCIRN